MQPQNDYTRPHDICGDGSSQKQRREQQQPLMGYPTLPSQQQNAANSVVPQHASAPAYTYPDPRAPVGSPPEGPVQRLPSYNTSERLTRDGVHSTTSTM